MTTLVLYYSMSHCHLSRTGVLGANGPQKNKVQLIIKVYDWVGRNDLRGTAELT